MRLEEFDYALPKELIARRPSGQRDGCRLMVLERPSKNISHRSFREIVDYFKNGDCLVLNDTKVIPARIFGRRRTGGKVEVFLLEKKSPVCEALVRPSARLKEGEEIELFSGGSLTVLARGRVGRLVRFSDPIDEVLEKHGHMPLPPYIDRPDEESDRSDYQTVYASHDGATASPTAGLHFTRELLGKIEEKGVKIARLTLHTSYGTFAPIKTRQVEEHKMHAEYFDLPEETAKAVNACRRGGGRIFAVGTTSTRVLEHCADKLRAASNERRATDVKGTTDMYIYPGYKFRVVDHIITNFHLPKSTLLLLTSAFAGRDFILEAYREAVKKSYRFFSYGDAMLIL